MCVFGGQVIGEYQAEYMLVYISLWVSSTARDGDDGVDDDV